MENFPEEKMHEPSVDVDEERETLGYVVVGLSRLWKKQNEGEDCS